MYTSIQAAAPHYKSAQPRLKGFGSFCKFPPPPATAGGFCPLGREKTLLGRNHWSDSKAHHVDSINLIPMFTNIYN